MRSSIGLDPFMLGRIPPLVNSCNRRKLFEGKNSRQTKTQCLQRALVHCQNQKDRLACERPRYPSPCLFRDFYNTILTSEPTYLISSASTKFRLRQAAAMKQRHSLRKLAAAKRHDTAFSEQAAATRQRHSLYTRLRPRGNDTAAQNRLRP